MNYNNLILGCIFLSFIVALSSCDKDDKNNHVDPEGAATLNMMNEDNGKTILGHSDVYIDNANNFYSETCLLSHLGKKSGLGSISDILPSNGSNTVAVKPGNAYQIFKSTAIKKFPSGKLALNIESDYYNLYVVSQIKQSDGDVIGANVKYILMDAPNYGLPEYDKFIGTIDHRDGNTWEIILDLPTSDFEYEFVDIFNVTTEIAYQKVGDKIVIEFIEYKDWNCRFGFYIRIKDSYTFVHGNLQ